MKAPIAKVICFDASYNRGCEGENITRVRDWGEVEELVGRILDYSACNSH